LCPAVFFLGAAAYHQISVQDNENEIKLALLIRSLDYGGAERQLVTLAKGLDQRRFVVTVLCFYPGGALLRELSASGIRHISLDKRGRWDVFGFGWRLVRQLRITRPHVLLSFLDVPNVISVLLKPFCHEMKVVWAVGIANLPLSRYDWLSRLSFRLERLLSRFADLIITNSHAGRAECLTKGFPTKKTVTISNGIDTHRFRPDPEARTKVRVQLGIAGDTKLIGIIGRLDPVKDHSTFLRAAALLSKQRDDVSFVCVGDGDGAYATKLSQMATELGLAKRVLWVGAQEDMAATYNSLDLLASSSVAEGFANALGEAMSCGVPCVVTDVGDSAWVVGDTGKVVPKGNPEALAAAILSVLQHEGPKVGQATRNRIVETFSVAQLVETTESQLLSLL
jgi:glycosyltransferase involved in cell wall biosynthesis